MLAYNLSVAFLYSVVCGEVHDGKLSSPNYPGRYPNGYNCTWRVTVPNGKIVINIDPFNIENSVHCLNDYLLVSLLSHLVFLLLQKCVVSIYHNYYRHWSVV